MIPIVYLAISHHTEYTRSDNVGLVVGVNKHLKCNIGLVCESRMFSRHRFSGGWERSHAGLKQEEMGAIARRPQTGD
ncbi:hypothetical protein QUB02_08380 [Microcoleus sp. D3_18_C1]